MQDYPLNEGAYEFRSLQGRDGKMPPMVGWDVYALQTLLNDSLEGVIVPLALDGVLGDKTAVAIWTYQKERGLVQDGKAGPETQRYLVLDQVHVVTRKYEIPKGLVRGHLQQESSLWVGNYTAPYKDGTRDLGLTMRHAAPSFEAKLVNFHGPQAIEFMYADTDRGVRPKKNSYIGQPGAPDHETAWELAVGSWNAPSVANSVAAGDRELPLWLEGYITKCTGRVKVWTP